MTCSLVLTGPLCAGKTTLAEALHEKLAFEVVSARAVLRSLASSPLASRTDLQRFGADLERLSPGSWLADAALEACRAGRPIVVDAGRTPAQISAVKTATGALHVHLSAHDTELARRFRCRDDDVIETESLAEALAHDIEQRAKLLGQEADLKIDTTNTTPEQVFQHVRAWLANQQDAG